MKGYLEIHKRVECFFAVFFECDLFYAKLLGCFLGPNSNVTTFKGLQIVTSSLSILLQGMTPIGVAKEGGGRAPPN